MTDRTFLSQKPPHPVIADPKMEDLSALVQEIKGSGNLFRFNKDIRTVQEKNIQVFSLQPSEASFHRSNNMFVAKIIETWTDGAFRLHGDIENPESDLMVAFRSSPYGGVSHGHASQNDFMVMKGGRARSRSKAAG